MNRHATLTLGMFASLAIGGSCLAAPGNCQSSQTASLGALGDRQDIVDTAVGAGSFQTLAAALTAADLIDALKGDGPFTVFAPTDEAFAKLPAGTVETLLKPENKAMLQAILTYHVVSGEVTAETVVTLSNAATLNGQRIDISTDNGVKVDDANVIQTDIMCSNGVIHVIDRVIMPSTDDILETAAKAGSFETLAAAIKAAGLAATLSGEGPFTVFAPTDAAFANLPAGTIESLLEEANRDQLVAILKLHVVPGRVYSDQAAKAGQAKSLQGGELKFARGRYGLTVNGAGIISPDVETSNGVIHVIDTVLLPS